MEEFTPKIKQPKEAVKVKTFDKATPLSEEQKQLVEQGYKQVKIIANKMYRDIKNENTSFQIDDFIAWGTEGLIEAAKKFDSSQGYKFDSFAVKFIGGRIIDNLRDQNTISRKHLGFLQVREKAIEFLHKELKRKPTEKEIAEKMGLTLEKYIKKLETFPIDAGVVSLTDFPDNSGNIETDSFLDKISQEINPYGSKDEDNKEFIIELLNKFLDQLNLNEKEHQVMEMYFTEGMTFKEIGEKLGFTESNASLIKSAVLNKLKRLFKEQGYKVLPENILRGTWKYTKKKKTEIAPQ